MKNEQLTPKQLAAALGRSVRYVRWMVSAGYRFQDGTTDAETAREWIERTGFVIVHGKGRTANLGSPLGDCKIGKLG